DVRPVHGRLVTRHELGFGRSGRALLGLLARGLELAPQHLRLAGALVQPRIGLAGGDGLDAPRTGAHRAFAEDRERADLRGRAHMGPAAKLARVAVDLDDANDVAVLFAEQHLRAELARLL